jgi:putative ATP-dependent endonuclease of OLD family
MHDVVLVPEGRIDKEWIDLLGRAVDARQGWNPNEESRFGSYVGVVPTHDGAVLATWRALQDLHPRIVTLVDGDNAGIGYAKELTSGDKRPSVILQWPKGWLIEDVVGWTLSADPAAAVSAVNAVLDSPVVSVDELVSRLKSETKLPKGNYVAYEAVATVIGDITACADRARAVLNAISDRSLSRETARFASDPGLPDVSVFVP